MLVFIILLVVAAIIFKVADTQLNKNNDKVLSSDARTLDRQHSSKLGKLMRLLKETGLLILSEILFLPVYLFILIGIVFNDSGYTTSSFVDFFGIIIPIYVYVILTGLIVFLMRKYKKAHIFVLTIYILVHLAISVSAGFMYMLAYMPNEINEKYNPIVIHYDKKILEEKQSLEKQQEQDYQDYMTKKESYELIFEKDLDDVQYKITKNNDIFYFEYKNKKNNDSFVKELTTSDSLAKITPIRQRSLYDSDKYEMYFNYYNLIENNSTRNVNYISIPSLDFYYSFDDDEYESDIIINNERTNFDKFFYSFLYGSDKYKGDIIINNERTNFNRFFHELFLENIHFYKLSYKDGMLIRSDEIGENIVWNIYENGERILGRVADNELELKLSNLGSTFQKGHTYTVYLTYLGTSTQVSNSVAFTY